MFEFMVFYWLIAGWSGVIWYYTTYEDFDILLYIAILVTGGILAPIVLLEFIFRGETRR